MPSSVSGRNDRSVRVFVARFLSILLALATPLAASAQIPLSNGIAIVTGDSHSCVVVQGGGQKCWGRWTAGQTGHMSDPKVRVALDVDVSVSDVSKIVAGANHTCIVTTTGALTCWGDNSYEQIVPGMSWALSYATERPDISGVTAAALGRAHTCALSAGVVKCWGTNDHGQLGVSTLVTFGATQTVDGLPAGIAAIASGSDHMCAITGTGGVQCWGDNRSGQLGDGGTDDPGRAIPEAVPGLTDVTALAAGEHHTCALTAAGTVTCWGSNAHGQLGNVSAAGGASSPVDVTGLAGVDAIAAGSAHTCALSDGEVSCWGDNGHGQSGVDATTSTQPTPAAVAGLDGVVAITAGGARTCALRSDGSAKCWGDNRHGAIGDDTLIDRSAPTAVHVATVPEAPVITAMSMTLTDDVRISFTEPVRNGGFPIQWYQVRDGAGNSLAVCARPESWLLPVPHCDVQGVELGRAYTFTIEAISYLGASARSAPSDPFTPRGTMSISINAPGDRTYGESPFVLVGTAGLPGSTVVFASLTPATCTTSGTNGTTLTFVGAGSCTIRASVAGSAAYFPAERTILLLIRRAQQVLTVPASLPAVASGQTTSFAVTGGGSVNPVAFTSKTPAHCSVQGQGTALVTAIGAGTCEIEASQDGDANHEAAAPRTVSLAVSNTAPMAADDTYAKAALSITGNVLSNDADPGNDALTVSVDVEPMHGALSMAADGHFTYRPADGYVGADSFAYTATDPFGASDSALVTLDVPVPNAERIAVAGGVPIVDIASLWSGEFAVATSGAQYYRLRADLSVKHAISTGATLDSVGLIADGTAFLAAENTFLYAFSPLGVSLDHWPRAVGSRVAQSMAATDAGTVFVCPRNGIVQVIDRENRIQGSTLLGDDCAAAPLLLPDADAGVVVSIAGDGAVFSLSGFTGGELDVVRRFFLPSPPATPLSAVDGSTFVWIDQAGYLRKADAVDASDATASAGAVGLQPAGDVLTRDDGSLVFAGAAAAQGRACLYSAALAPVWCATLEAPVAGTGVLGRPGEVYFPLATGRIVRIDLDTGDVTAAVQATDAGAIASDLLFDGARIYVGDTSGSIARVLVTDFDALAAGSAAKHASKAMVPQGYWTGAMGGRMRNGRASAAQFGAAMIFGGNFE